MRDTADFEADQQDASQPDDLCDKTCAAGLLHDVEPGILATLQGEDIAHANKSRSSMFKLADGTSQPVHFHRHFREHYRDEYTSELLPKEWVESAIADELGYFNERVWVGDSSKMQ